VPLLLEGGSGRRSERAAEPAIRNSRFERAADDEEVTVDATDTIGRSRFARASDGRDVTAAVRPSGGWPAGQP
jgi:hypothetical protein